MDNQKTILEAEVSVQQEAERNVQQELTKNNVTKAVIEKFKTDYMKLTITDLNDKEQYETVKAARIQCRNTRVLAQKICKRGREASLITQRAWIATEKDIVIRINEIEDHLAAEQAKVDNERERLANQEKEEKERKMKDRFQRVHAAGAMFNGEVYILGDTKATDLTIREMDDSSFESFLRAVENEAKIIADKRAVADKLEAEARERQEKIESEQRAEREKQEAERRKLEDEKRKLEQEKEELEKQKRKSRIERVNAAGLSYNGNNFVFENISTHVEEFMKLSEVEFNELISSLTEQVKQKKDELIKAEANKRQREQAELEARVRKEEAEKLEREKQQKEEREQQQREEEARLAELKPDKEKLRGYAAGLKLFFEQEVTVKNKASKKLVESIKLQLETVHSTLITSIEKLK